jgi:hypothetical protein
MMGERWVMQGAVFYGFTLERHVPDNHLLRKIDRFVDLSGLVIAHPRGWLVQAGRGIGFSWRVRRIASMARIERRRAVSTTERMSP